MTPQMTREERDARFAAIFDAAIAAGKAACVGIPDKGAVGWGGVWVKGNTPFAHWLRKTGNGRARHFGVWGKGTGFSDMSPIQAITGARAFCAACEAHLRSEGIDARSATFYD